MSSLVVVSGNVGNVKPVQQVGESQVLNFSVASNEFDGKQKKTVWYNCALWNVPNLFPYITKGKIVTVRGVLETDENGYVRIWNDKDGQPRANLNIRVDHLDLLGGGNREDAPQTVAAEDFTSDIPF